jgi:hypothetical protein
VTRVEVRARNQVCSPIWIRGRVTGGRPCIPGVQSGTPGEGEDFRAVEDARRHFDQMRGYDWEILEWREVEE